jgi:hypothetical protein
MVTPRTVIDGMTSLGILGTLLTAVRPAGNWPFLVSTGYTLLHSFPPDWPENRSIDAFAGKTSTSVGRQEGLSDGSACDPRCQMRCHSWIHSRRIPERQLARPRLSREEPNAAWCASGVRGFE